MNVLDLLSSEIICSRLFRSIRWSSGIYCPRCNSRNIKGHGKYKQVLKDTFVNLIRELLMIRLEQFSIIQA
jgi:DNA-directed RNA polymerase subunit RPC12/RpoP